MKINITNRLFLYILCFFLYFLPIFIFSFYAFQKLPLDQNWSLWSAAFLLTTFFALFFFFLLAQWESSLLKEKERSHFQQEDNLKQEKEPFSNEKEWNQKEKEWEEQLKTAQSDHAKLQETHEHLNNKHKKILKEFSDYKFSKEEELKQKKFQISELERIIENQRNEMEIRQQQVSQLDTKVHDLSDEIKTLLHSDKEEKTAQKTLFKTSNSPLSTYNSSAPLLKTQEIHLLSEEEKSKMQQAADVLKKCIEAAEKITGSNYLVNENARYREFSSSYYAIDQRRLFDQFREESEWMIVVFSPKNYKPLFVNPSCKSILGWLPEKMTADFSTIIQASALEWKKGLDQLKKNGEFSLRILAKTKQGKEVLLHSLLKSVSTGLFKDYVIAIFYPA